MSLSYHLPNISGIGVYVKNLSEGLVQKGHEVTVLTSQHKKNLKRKEKIKGVNIERVPISLQLGKGPIMLKFPFIGFSEVRKADVVHVHLPQFEAIFLSIWAKILGKKLIVTSHTDLSLWAGILNIISFVIVNISHFFTFLLADKISTYTKDYAENSYINKYFLSKIEPIYPPIKMPKPKTEYKIDIDQSYYTIGFVGRIAKQKGLHFLLKSIDYLKHNLDKNFKIVLIGPSKEVIGEDHISQMQELIEKYEEYLLFTGKIDFENISSVYSQLDLMVLPSHDRLESFGFVQVESMLEGTPVVATNLPGVRQVIKKTGMGEIAKVADPKDLAHKIELVLENSKNYEVKKSKIRKIFNVKETINEYERLYQR
jgi:glycosyltransferase involved in cell wall biosynthesis